MPPQHVHFLEWKPFGGCGQLGTNAIEALRLRGANDNRAHSNVPPSCRAQNKGEKMAELP